jgi:hypothetical protein
MQKQNKNKTCFHDMKTMTVNHTRQRWRLNTIRNTFGMVHVRVLVSFV